MAKKDWFARFFIIVVPVGLLIATVVGILIHVYNKGDGSMERDRRLSRPYSQSEVEAFKKKLTTFMPVRGLENAMTREALQTTGTMIAGTLSAENAGYAEGRGESVAASGAVFQPVFADLKGEDDDKVVRVMTRYDGGAEQAGAVAAALAVAQSMSSDRPPVTVRFIFLTGLEPAPLGVGAKRSERYGRTIWFGPEPPAARAGLLHVPAPEGEATAAGLKLREEIDRAVYDLDR